MTENPSTHKTKLKVYRLCRQIPKGKVSTYSVLAKLAGTSPRTVGKLLSENHDKDVPCHRVIMSNRTLGGYNKGIQTKRWLLQSEGITFTKGRVSKKHL